MSKDLNNRFDFHPATTAEKRDEHGSVRQVIKRAAEAVDELVPEGREKSLSITNLEEAMFWANAGIARNNNDEE